MKTEKRKANVGERILITDAVQTRGIYANGDILTVKALGRLGRGVNVLEHGRGIFQSEYEVIVETPKKSARITALETQVSLLQAKVEALEKAGKAPKEHGTLATLYPLTERFERESSASNEVMDAILADIERKAKPTLEALLATYPPKTPNEQRADVIKRAKAFVAEYEGILEDDAIIRVEFVVNPDKRTVVAIAHGRLTKKIRKKAFAKCDPDDVFNADIGKAIALARALGVEVPVEFVKAVQPTEVVVGQRVQSLIFGDTQYNVTEINGDKAYVDHTTRYYGVDRINIAYKVIDDTDAVYE